MTRPVCFLTLLLSCFSGPVSADDCSPVPGASVPGCTCMAEDGVIDLTSIASQSGEVMYSADDPDNPFTYGYNPCYGMSQVQSGCSGSDTSVCQYNYENGLNIAVSRIENEKIVYDGSSFYLEYVGGDDGRTAVVELICTASTDTNFNFVSEGEGLVYNFQLSTICACPGGCGDAIPTGSTNIEVEISGPIGISLVCLFIVSIMAYFIVGALIMKFHYKRSGLDLIPQRELWFGLPFLIKDGFIFTFSPCLSVAGIDCGKKGYDAL